MMQTKRYMPALLVGLIALCAPFAGAQYDQNISVEGKYVPEYIAQDRIGLFPKVVKFPLDKSSLAFASEGVNADFTPNAIPIPATGWGDTPRWSRARGYLDLGLGSWLESTLSAGYRFVDDEAMRFGVRLQHNSSSLWKARIDDAVSRRLRRYDEVLGLYGSHHFGGKGRLDASLDYHFGHYNYYGYNPGAPAAGATPADVSAPWQTLNDVAARVGWQSEAGGNLDWRLGVGYRYFGMRRLYADTGLPGSLCGYTGGRESDLSLTGALLAGSAAGSAFGLDLEAHCLAYPGATVLEDLASGTKTVVTPGYVPASFHPDTYGTLSLTPYYRFVRSRLAIRLGARVDLAFNARTEDGRYRTFNIAPSVKVDYDGGPFALYLHVMGGNRLSTLAEAWHQDYYCLPALTASVPEYTPFDAKAGFSVGPFAGFSAGIDVAYRLTQNQRIYGWYTASLGGNGNATSVGLPAMLDGAAIYWFDPADQRYTIRGFSLGARLAYDSGRYFKVEADGTWQPQSGKTGYYNGMDRPRWTAHAEISSNPWSTLRLGLACNYRGVRNFPIFGTLENAADPQGWSLRTLYMHRVEDWFSLDFRASYQINGRIGVWLEADNLTNRGNLLAPGLPQPGITLAAGMNFTF